MNLYSIAAAFGAVACVSLTIGLQSRRSAEAHRSAGVVWAIAVSLSLALPILLSSNLHDCSRIFIPREAIDWLPSGLIVLAVIYTMAVLRAKSANTSLALAGLVCMALATRMLYGGIYFRAGTLEWTSVGWSILWGGAIASCWLVAWNQLDILTWIDGGIWLVVVAELALALVMSGSVVYGVSAGLLWVSMLFGWLGASRLTAFVCVPGITLVGLGIAYAELSLISGALLTLSMFVLSSKTRVSNRSQQIAFLLMAVGFSTAGVGLVASKFIGNSVSTDSGYGAYK